MAAGTAFTRAVSPRLAECALTHLARQPIDATRAAQQHADYEATLAAAGFDTVRLPPLPDFPDGVFVEDTAMLLGDHAVITRPGAASRRGETEATAAGLDGRFTLTRLATGHVDGGDVLAIGRTLYVGLSGRTDRAGLESLAEAVRPLGYNVIAVAVQACLHLKSAATFAGRDASGAPVLVYDPCAIAPDAFAGVVPLAVAPGEAVAANVLRAGGTLIMAAHCPGTAERLAARGFDIAPVDVSELHKAEAGLTCMSLIAPTIG